DPSCRLDQLDTTGGSAIHWLFHPFLHSRPLGALRLPAMYVASAGAIMVPMLVAALFGPHDLLAAGGALKLPFLRDWNVLFMFLVSFPCLSILIATDQSVLSSALKTV